MIGSIPAAVDDAGGDQVALAMQLGAGRRPGDITFIQEQLKRRRHDQPAAARDPGAGSGSSARLRPLPPDLLACPPAHLLLPLPLRHPHRSCRPLLRPHQPRLLPELPGHLRAGEVAAQRGMRDPVVASEYPQRLPRRPPPQF
jgi:hypothetical protein